MFRAHKIALTVAGPVGKAVVAFIGLMTVIAAVVPTPEPASGTQSEPGDPAQSTSTVTLRVPEGEPAGHMTVVDATGRELATVTHWYNGDVAVVARRDAGASVASYLNANGSTDVRVSGTARWTDIEAKPDGTAKVSFEDVPSGANPPREPETSR
jgi:hypothetical protein